VSSKRKTYRSRHIPHGKKANIPTPTTGGGQGGEAHSIPDGEADPAKNPKSPGGGGSNTTPRGTYVVVTTKPRTGIHRGADPPCGSRADVVSTTCLARRGISPTPLPHQRLLSTPLQLKGPLILKERAERLGWPNPTGNPNTLPSGECLSHWKHQEAKWHQLITLDEESRGAPQKGTARGEG
jgi:hypothetical protein